MDEKGFIIRVIGRSVRNFNKQQYKLKQYKQALRDGNRKWVTVLASICGDRLALPLAVIYSSLSNEVPQS